MFNNLLLRCSILALCISFFCSFKYISAFANDNFCSFSICSCFCSKFRASVNCVLCSLIKFNASINSFFCSLVDSFATLNCISNSLIVVNCLLIVLSSVSKFVFSVAYSCGVNVTASVGVEPYTEEAHNDKNNRNTPRILFSKLFDFNIHIYPLYITSPLLSIIFSFHTNYITTATSFITFTHYPQIPTFASRIRAVWFMSIKPIHVIGCFCMS